VTGAASATQVDTITGGAGNDTITAAAGHGTDVISVGDGNDVIDVHQTVGPQTITAGAGADTILSGSGNDNIHVGGGGDIIDGGAGSNTIAGGAGNDTIHGGAHGVNGTDILTGGGGQDVFIVSAGDTLASDGPSTPTLGITQIRDWTSSDLLDFGLAKGTSANFSETTATDFNDAIVQANNHLGQGDFVAVQVGTDVIVFADTNTFTSNSTPPTLGVSDHHITSDDDAVTLVGKTLADITFGNLH